MRKVEDTIQLRGKYHFKRRVPPEIRHHYGGKQVYQVSLKTADAVTAEREARRLRAIMDSQMQQAKAEEGWRALATNLPPDQRKMLENAGGLKGLLDEFERIQKAMVFVSVAEPQPEDFDHVDAHQIEDAAHRATLDAMRAQANAKGRTLRRLGQNVALEGDVFSLRDLVEDWAPSVDPQTADNARTYVRRFSEWHGEIALTELTGAHLREFIDEVAGLPKIQSGARREMTFRELLADARGAKCETIGYATQKKYFDMLKGLMSHALGRRFVEVDPWVKMKLPRPKVKHSAPKVRRSFTGDEVRKILDYVAASNVDQYQNATIDRWAPWIAAYQGFRLQEICQLRRKDFFEKDGVWSVRVTDEEEWQRVKNRNTVRVVPVHPELIAAGLKGVVEARPVDSLAFLQWGRYSKKLEDMKPDGRGRVSGEYGKRFSYLLRSKVKITDSEAVFHSFRHRFQDAADNAGLLDSHRRYLTGRANADAVEGGYGQGAALDVLLGSLANIDPT